MLDVADALADPLLLQSYTLSRKTGSFFEGRYTLGAPVETQAAAVIMPASANDMVIYLPEGDRVNKALKIFSKTELVMADGKGVESDSLIWHGEVYEIAFSKRFSDYGYWFAIAVKE